MKLIGQYDSPYVRRVAIALRLYGMDYDHLPLSTFADRDAVAAYNPLIRVPTLVLDDGAILIESGVILDWLDETVGPDRALLPVSGIARRDQLHIIAIISGIADKAVAFFYLKLFGGSPDSDYVARTEAQIGGALALLELQTAARSEDWWFGPTPGHADIAVACVIRLLRDLHPNLFSPSSFPALVNHCARCEAMPVFQDIQQVFDPPQ